MFIRWITRKFDDALADTPVVLVNGARQVGKTTLVKNRAKNLAGAVYRTLDDMATLAAARGDPLAFARQSATTLVVDEVQKVPELFPAIKQVVDEERRPGRFVLTGSANVLLLPKVSESLAGRVEILTLHALAQGEMEGAGPGLPSRWMNGDFATLDPRPEGRLALVERVVRGGYPEAVSRQQPERRQAWFSSYLTTLLQRDIRDLSNVEGLADFPRLLALLATRSGGILNASDLGRMLGIPHNTLKRYLTLLETTFLLRLLPAWSRNLGTRLGKAPKAHLRDTGLACSLMDVNATRLSANPTLWGALLESFAVNEVIAQAEAGPARLVPHHFRTSHGAEVDLVLEDRRGRVVGVEIKGTSRISSDDFSGLRSLERLAGSDWVGGVVFYTGDTVLPFGERLHAIPVSQLWSGPDVD